MSRRYRVFRKLINGEQMLVASRNERGEAADLVESLQQYWPGDYSVREEGYEEDALSGATEEGNDCAMSCGNERNN